MDVIENITKEMEDDWYGNIELRAASFEDDKNPRESLTGVKDYDLSAILILTDYSDEIRIHIVKPSDRSRVTYNSEQSCRLCDENDELTTNSVIWVKEDGMWMVVSHSVCGHCLSRVQTIVDENIYENEEITEDLVARSI